MNRIQLYIIQSGNDGPVKIGITRNSIKQRIKDLQGGNPEKLKLLRLFKNGEFKERDLHKKFSHLKLRGEWFEYKDELKNFINYPDTIGKGVMQQLDTQKLRVELAKIGRNYSWLADKIGYTKQYMSYLVKSESVKHISSIADALDVDPKDLIK